MTIQRFRNILLALMPLLISIGINLFYNSEATADIYVFYEHQRYLDNIFFDISNMLTFVIFSYFASKYDRKAFKPFFIISIIEIIGYFLFYKQFINLITMPTLIILLIIYNFNRK